MKLKYFRNPKTLIFDCDGVILNSNEVKREAFRRVALPFGQDAADKFVHFHLRNGGMSRYQKFKYFLEEVVPIHSRPASQPAGAYLTISDLSATFASYISNGLKTCEIAPGLDNLRKLMPRISWMVVSGSDQQELRQVLYERGVAHYFDAGIFGSPDSKDLIFKRELDSGRIVQRAFYLGDSFYDYQVAQRAGIEFIYVSGWSEDANRTAFKSANHLNSVENLLDLIEKAYKQ